MKKTPRARKPKPSPALRYEGVSMDQYLKAVEKFHGRMAPGAVLGGFMITLAAQNLPPAKFYDAIAETRSCLPDAIQLLTPCTIGNGWLRIVDTGRFALIIYDKKTGKGIRVSLNQARLKKWPALKAWAMMETPKAEQDEARLIFEVLSAGENVCKVEKVKVIRDRVRTKLKIFSCPLCGESFRGAGPGPCGSCSGEKSFYTVAS